MKEVIVSQVVFMILLFLYYQIIYLNSFTLRKYVGPSSGIMGSLGQNLEFILLAKWIQNPILAARMTRRTLGSL
jgi:hypothetical protein